MADAGRTAVPDLNAMARDVLDQIRYIVLGTIDDDGNDGRHWGPIDPDRADDVVEERCAVARSSPQRPESRLRR